MKIVAKDIDEVILWLKRNHYPIEHIVSMHFENVDLNNYIYDVIERSFDGCNYGICQFGAQFIISINGIGESQLYKMCYALNKALLQKDILVYMGMSSMTTDSISDMVNDSLGALFRAKKEHLPIVVGTIEEIERIDIPASKDLRFFYDNLSRDERKNLEYVFRDRLLNLMRKNSNRKIYINYQEDSNEDTASKIKDFLSNYGLEGFYIPCIPGFASAGIEYIRDRLQKISTTQCLLILSNNNTVKRDRNLNFDMNSIDSASYMTKGDVECCRTHDVVAKVIYCKDMHEAMTELKMIIQTIYEVC